MRPVKFRALNFNGTWAYGSLVIGSRTVGIYSRPTFANIISAENHKTVGQFTGLLDKYGKEIYEGDIVRCKDGLGVVHFKAPAFIVCDKDGEWLLGNNTLYPAEAAQLVDTEVIGNIHENPELLEP